MSKSSSKNPLSLLYSHSIESFNLLQFPPSFTISNISSADTHILYVYIKRNSKAKRLNEESSLFDSQINAEKCAALCDSADWNKRNPHRAKIASGAASHDSNGNNNYYYTQVSLSHVVCIRVHSVFSYFQHHLEKKTSCTI